MEVVIDKLGRIVIPKEVRSALDLKPGTRLVLRWDDDGLELRPAEAVPVLKERDGHLIFCGDLSGDPQAVQAQLRAERTARISGL